MLLIVAAANAVAIAAMLRLRRRAPRGSYFADTQQASAAFEVTGTIFAVLVGFVFLIAFQSYGKANTSSDDEAAATQALFHSAELFPAADTARLQSELLCYARAVIEQEWPAMADERRSATVDLWRDRLEDSFRGVPAALREGAAGENWFAETDSRTSGRLDRLSEAEPFVPTAIWTLLIIAAVVIVCFVLLFADAGERRRSQAMMAGAVTTAVVASLLTIAFLDQAYGDHPGAIGPEAMETSLDEMDRERARRDQAAPLPCDERGDPASALVWIPREIPPRAASSSEPLRS